MSWIYISKARIRKDCEKKLTSIQKRRDVVPFSRGVEKEKKKHAFAITIFTVRLAESAEHNTEPRRVQRGDRQHANTSLWHRIEQTQLTYRDSA